MKVHARLVPIAALLGSVAFAQSAAPSARAGATSTPKPAAASPAQDAVAWYTDVGLACRDAAAQDRLVLVAVVEHGDPVSRAMWQRVWSGARFARHAKREVKPVLLAYGDPAGPNALPLPIAADRLQEATWHASRLLFGVAPTITTPQFLLLHADGSVLHQHLGEAAEAVLARAIERARLDGHASAAERRARQRAHADRLRVEAKSSVEAAERLAVLMRHADVETFGLVVEKIARSGEGRAPAVAQWLSGQPDARSRALWGQMQARPACGALLPEARHEVTVRSREVRTVFAPLPELRALPTLDAVSFAASAERPELRGRPVVLLFLLPDAGDLSVQLDALRPAIRELSASGAACVALFATLQPAADLARVTKLDLPCPVGTYAYDATAPLAGVAHFPASLVADDAGRVVFVADQPGVRPYAEFLPTARGLLRYRAERPTLRRATSRG